MWLPKHRMNFRFSSKLLKGEINYNCFAKCVIYLWDFAELNLQSSKKKASVRYPDSDENKILNF